MLRNMVSTRLKPVLAVLGAVFFLFSWELLSYGQLQVFFNKVFVAYNDADPFCNGSAGTITHGTSDTGGQGSGPNFSVSYPAISSHGGATPPATIAFSQVTVNSHVQTTGSTNFPYPGGCLHLCAQLGYANQTGANVPVDSMVMEIFKFLPGSNPLDSGSTPPIRTFTFSAIGEMVGINDTFDVNNGILKVGAPTTGALPGGNTALCAGWDGSYNIEGEFGRTNGQFGFRVNATTHHTSQTQGNITFATSPPGVYPGMEKPGDPTTLGAATLQVGQSPITIEAMDVHFVRSTPSVVGQITAVASQPYNLQYRLSKDATVQVVISKVNPSSNPGNLSPIRHIVNFVPRVGEGIPNGTLTNGDFWDGRDDAGQIVPPATYVFGVYAQTRNIIEGPTGDKLNLITSNGAEPDFGGVPGNGVLPLGGADAAESVARSIGVDPLQVTDIRVAPLLDASTSLATLTYILTEDATAFVDIYAPGTTFGNPGITTNFNITAPALNSAPCTPTNRAPSCYLNGGNLIRGLSEEKRARVQVLSFWDGRDATGRVMEDGDYPFLLYAHLPSNAGFPYTGADGSSQGPVVWTSKFQTGNLSVIRGLPGTTQITPRFTTAGSSPAVGGLNPFTFNYAVTRDSIVSLKIFQATATTNGSVVVKTLVNQETRAAGLTNTEVWNDVYDDRGMALSSGVYVAQLTVQDPFFAGKISTVTASFPIDLWRITDVRSTPLLAGASDQVLINYQLSQPMNATLAIYPPGTVINQVAQWPPCGSSSATANCGLITASGGSAATAVNVISGFRPGRLRITEFWDGRDGTGLLVPDGTYPFTLIAQSTTTPSYFATDRVVGSVTIARGQIQFTAFQIIPTVPALSNSSDTLTLPPFEIDYVVSRQSSVTVQALTSFNPPTSVRTILAGGIRDASILNREFWDGRDDAGNFVAPGFYNIRVVARDLASQLSSGSTQQQTVAVDTLRIFDVAVSPVTLDSPESTIAYQVSEAMKVSVKIYKPGTSFDINRNPIPPENSSLVRRIVSIKPGRTPVKDFWDGRDFKLTQVPDGNYIFRIIASTDINAIDTFTGNARPGASLAEDVITAEVAVVRGGSDNPEQEFVQNTAIYPNPARGSQVTFEIDVPIQANVFLKIFNLAGDLIRSETLGNIAGGQKATFLWQKDNASGNKVAHGVYFAVIREEASAGDATVFQTVKKILIP